MIRRLLLLIALALAWPAAAQSVPATNYTDMWYAGEAESGWGISFVQHAGTHQVYAVWYHYDPREPDPSTGQFKPLWLVMPAPVTWTSPTSVTGTVYVTNGVPFSQAGSNTRVTSVGTFAFNFTSTSTGTFTYNIAAPAGLASTDPAFNLPALSGTKSITRQGF
jgi:hypothetical protein